MAGWASRLHTTIAEIKRRNVFKVATVYAVAAWGASLGAVELLPAIGAPTWAVRMFLICTALGFPIAIALAWIYEITPLGLVRESKSSDENNRFLPATLKPIDVGPTGAVRVRWRDAAGHHEKVFTSGFVIGRDDTCQVHLDDPMVSRRHAEIAFEDGIWWITDLGSRNGTTVNGEKVTRAPLPPYCEVLFYDTAPVLQIVVHASSDASTVASSRIRVGSS